MIKYITSILNSKNPNLHVLQNLLLIAIVAFIFHIYKSKKEQMTPKEGMQGFHQSDIFVFKQDLEIYDEFYIEIYDIIFETIKRSDWELENILKITNPDTENSVILDVGCKTGYKVNELQNKGFRVFGIERSLELIKHSETLYPDVLIKHGNVYDPMEFEKSSFTHVLCLHFTIYEMNNKLDFFRNCYFWMYPNTYLILHLVDPLSFNATIPHVDNEWKPEKYKKYKRNTDTVVTFYDFKYHSHYEFPENMTNTDTNIVRFTETFRHNKTKEIRENQQILYMDSITDILKMAVRAGFIVQGKINMKDFNDDENQYIYILERTL
jgi:SAM-dependent methyltransferase